MRMQSPKITNRLAVTDTLHLPMTIGTRLAGVRACTRADVPVLCFRTGRYRGTMNMATFAAYRGRAHRSGVMRNACVRAARSSDHDVRPFATLLGCR
jgi:hypothetical protein